MTSNITNQDPHVYEFLTNQINPKGIIHISHGMAEHIPRYKWLISRFNDDGYHVIAKDHRGHGLSINAKDVKGFFSDKDGWNKVVSDLETVIADSRNKFPNLDQFLIGHSMGSWIALSALAKGLNIKGLILSGSSKSYTLPNIPLLLMGNWLTSDTLSTSGNCLMACKSWLTIDRK